MALEHLLARHLNFLVPSQVRAPLLDLSYSPYYPEVQAACSGATAAPGAGTMHYQQCIPPGYVNATDYVLLRDCNSHKVHHQMATPTISTTSQSLVSPYRAM